MRQQRLRVTSSNGDKEYFKAIRHVAPLATSECPMHSTNNDDAEIVWKNTCTFRLLQLLRIQRMQIAQRRTGEFYHYGKRASKTNSRAV